MKRPALIVGLILVVGLAGTAVALRSREGNAQFTAHQQALLRVDGSAVQRLLLTTSDPRPGLGGRARSAHCSSDSPLPLGNPWSCVVRYPHLPLIRYRTFVYADRSIRGSGLPEGATHGTPLIVSGCCVAAS